jgi:hypothetical protein
MAQTPHRTFRLDADTMALLSALAEETGISYTDVVRMAIRWLSKQRSITAAQLPIRIPPVTPTSVQPPLAAERHRTDSVPPEDSHGTATVQPMDRLPDIYIDTTTGEITGEKDVETPVVAKSVEGGSLRGADSAAVRNVFGYYQQHIHPKARLVPHDKIKARLKTFSVDELRQAVDSFKKDEWWMENNATRGARWFFNSDERIEQFLNLRPRPATPSRNGHAKTTSERGANTPWEPYLLVTEPVPGGHGEMRAMNVPNPHYDPTARRPKGARL